VHSRILSTASDTDVIIARESYLSDLGRHWLKKPL
jgi:hypothetical protein